MSMPEFDKDGYPSEISLQHLVGNNWSSYRSWLDYAKALWNDHYGGREESDGKVILITGGWSGNESVVTAMNHNIYWQMMWYESHRGGKYVLIAPSPPSEPSEPSFDYTHAKGALCNVLYRMNWGCGNHGCRIAKPKGQATNGSCQCSPKQFIRDLLDVAEMIERGGK